MRLGILSLKPSNQIVEYRIRESEILLPIV